jgi:CHAT domain-containing protein
LEHRFEEWGDTALPAQRFHARFLLSEIYLAHGRSAEATTQLESLFRDISIYRQALPGILGAWFWNERHKVFDTYLGILAKTAESQDEMWSALLTLDEMTNIENVHLGTEKVPTGEDALEAEQELRSLLVQRSMLTSADDILENSIALDKHLMNLGRQREGVENDKIFLLSEAASQFGNSALLTYYVSLERAWMWYLDADGIRQTELADSDKLAQTIQMANNALEWKGGDQRTSVFNDLGNSLLGEIDRKLPRNLKFYATGALVGFPMGTLKLADRFLVEDHDIVNVLSLESVFEAHEDQNLPLSEMTMSIRGPSPRNNHDLAGAMEEVAMVSDKVGGIFETVTVIDRSNEGNSISDPILDGDIVHIAGHGYFNPEYPEFSQLSVGGEDLSSGNGLFITPIELSGDDRNNAGMVFLSSCQSAGASKFDFEPASGFVTQLLDTGIDVVIASLWPVPDRKTAEFVVRFYTQLLIYQNYSQALAQTKRIHINKYPEGAIADWAAFQIFVR